MKAIATLGFALLTGSSAAAQDVAVEQAIDAVVQKWQDGWNAGDAAACVALHAEGTDRIGYDGEVWTGRASMQESLTETIAAYGGSTLRLTRAALHVVSPEVVVTDGSWEISGGTPEGSPTSGFYTFVLAKEGDAWQIVALRVKVPPTAN